MNTKSPEVLKKTIPLTALLSAFALICTTAAAQQPQQPQQPGRTVRSAGTPINTRQRTPAPAANTASRRGVVNTRNPSPSMPAIPYDDSPNGLNFQEAAADLVIMEYASRTQLTVIKDPATPAPTITLRSTPGIPLSDEEYLLAIKTALNLNGIALVEERPFLKVFPSSDIRQHGIKMTFVTDPNSENSQLPENGQFVSRMIELRNIDITEAQSVIEGFVRAGAKIQTFERSNSILVTDSVENVNRIIEIIGYIDRPIIAREESNIIHIRYAKATDIKERLVEIIEDSQNADEANKKTSSAQERNSGPPGTVARRLPSGVTLPNRRNQPAREAQSNETFESLIADAQRGIIRGRVSIFADERTNLLIIITRPENMVFFNKIIEELDVPTAPDFVVEVLRLEHAVAEDVANLLNELISSDASTSSSDNRVRAQNENESSSEQRTPSAQQQQRRNAQKASTSDKNKIGQLDAENIKILADERTNAIVIMSSYADMLSIKQIVEQMDIMLSQVVIETVIVSVTFADSNETGMDWVQRAMLSGSGSGGDSPGIAFATAGGGGTTTPRNALTLTSTSDLTTSDLNGGVTFIGTIFDLNIDLILRAIQTDNRSRLMSSPRITTLDNKEAVLESTDRIYWKEGTTYYSNSDYTSENIKNEDIGIKLTVTPRINKNGYITLTIEQEIQTNDGFTTLNGSDYPNLNTRKMGADVAVQSGETVVLGGLAQNSISTSQTKVPILGSIPVLGWLFRSTKEEHTRQEIIVFLTPRVIDTPAAIEDDARKIKSTVDTLGVWDSSWSNSRLADPVPEDFRKHIIELGRKTVSPPSAPLSGYLSNLNDEFFTTNSLPEAGSSSDTKEPKEEPMFPYTRYGDHDNQQSEYPYTHFTDDKYLHNFKPLPRGVVLPENIDSDTDVAPETVPESRNSQEQGAAAVRTASGQTPKQDSNSSPAAPQGTAGELEKTINDILDQNM